MIGVYTITNLINNKIYVGSSTISILGRFKSHQNQLNRGVHHNQILQNAYNKYGKEAFKFEILEECNKEYCLSTEQFWINMLSACDKKLGYNINCNAGNRAGTHVSENTREKIRLIQKNEIHQYDITGTFIKSFNTIKEASIELKIWDNQIGGVINNKKSYTQAHGYLFVKNHTEIKEKLDRFHNKRLKIYQYDLQGNFIREWRNKEEIKKRYNYCLSTKELDKNRSAAGFQWRTYKKVNINPYIKNGQYNKRIVLKYTLNGEFICEYDSVTKAAESVKSSSTLISGACTNNKVSKGFIWKYK